MFRNLFSLALCCTLLFVSGCQKSSVPVDLPKLYPCNITITQDGKPLEGATVELLLSEEQAKYKAAAITDSQGVAVMSTYGYEGTPLGKYKVIVAKNIQDNLVYAESSTGTKEVVGWTSYCTIEPIYSDAKTTPHEIEITGKNKATATFDVGKAIKKRL